MFVAPVDATSGEDEWRPFVESHPFGHLVAPGGPERALPVVVPTQFVLDADTVWLHLVRGNPIFDALAENRRVLLSVADDWAFIPSSWKAIGEEDPALGIPTTYYGAVQLAGETTVHDERSVPGSVATILRRQLDRFQPEEAVADPAVAHASKLLAILGLEIRIEHVTAKFKYGGNVDAAHRRGVVQRLGERAGPGDAAASAHVLRRLAQP
jgi:transcriptional regulator